MAGAQHSPCSQEISLWGLWRFPSVKGLTRSKVTLGRVSPLLFTQPGCPDSELSTEAIRASAPDPDGDSGRAQQRGGLWGLLPVSRALEADKTGERGEVGG